MSFARLWQSMVTELVRAVRSRRAVVVLVLYLAASLLCMNGSISFLGKIENQLSEVLQLERSEEKSGVVSVTLWRSKQFQKIVRHAVGDSLVYDDICGRHPAELIYAFLAFLYVPLLTILISANRAADDLRSGSVRYMITRVTRFEWSFGKYLGISVLLLAGLLSGAVAAWAVAVFRLGGADFVDLGFGMLGWALKAWVLSLGWLGISLGVSHFFHSGSKATALAMIVMTAFAIIPKVVGFLADKGGVWQQLLILNRLFPGAVEDGLWRASFVPVACTTVWIVMLGLFYFSIGYAFFDRRDAR